MQLNPSRSASRILVAAVALNVTWCFAEEHREAPPIELVKLAVANEIKATNQTAKCMFRELKETPNGSQTKLLVQTREAMVGMVVAYNGRPLNADERQGEYGRIQRYLDDPAELDRKRRKEKEDSERVISILKALPDAFLYEYDGADAGRGGAGKAGQSTGAAQFTYLNPKDELPTRVEQVLTGMQGVVLGDPGNLASPESMAHSFRM